jgi:uncharacterized FlaG/YvyC family protein
MAEDEISDTGQFSSIGAVDSASYSTSSSGLYPSLGSAAASPPAAAQATAPPSTPPVTSSPSTTGTPPPTAAQIQSAVDAANVNLSSAGRQLDYRVDASTGITVALIRNSQTGVVVQQIPGADIIALARMLADWSPGKHMLLDLIA